MASVQRIVAQFRAQPDDFVYLDHAAFPRSIWATRGLQVALLYNKRSQVLLAVYFNPTATDCLLKGSVRRR